MKAKTEHIINESDFVGILPMLSVSWKMVEKEYVYFFVRGFELGGKLAVIFH